jgi:CHAT domain-containing protein
LNNKNQAPNIEEERDLELENIVGNLLSSHGIFNIKNAWESSIKTADGRVELSKLLLDHSKIAADLVVLAPMWMVDDYSSHLFLTAFFQFISEGIHPASALQKTSVWR